MNKVWLPAHTSNYSKGRGKAVRYITVHHMAGTPETLQYLWQNPNRNASSHYGVFPNKIEQYVSEGDTAWCNGNWDSNQESISIETWGNWQNGFVNHEVIANLRSLLKDLRVRYPGVLLNFHNDVYNTFCPGELKGYAQDLWNQITVELTTPPPPPPKPAPLLEVQPIPKQKMMFNKNARLWAFNFKTWSAAEPANDKVYPQGQIIEIVAVATNTLGAKYGMTAYSYNDGNIRAHNGFNMADMSVYVETPPSANTDPVNSQSGNNGDNSVVDSPIVDTPTTTPSGTPEIIVAPEQPSLDPETLLPITDVVKDNWIIKIIKYIKELIWSKK